MTEAMTVEMRKKSRVPPAKGVGYSDEVQAVPMRKPIPTAMAIPIPTAYAGVGAEAIGLQIASLFDGEGVLTTSGDATREEAKRAKVDNEGADECVLSEGHSSGTAQLASHPHDQSPSGVHPSVAVPWAAVAIGEAGADCTEEWLPLASFGDVGATDDDDESMRRTLDVAAAIAEAAMSDASTHASWGYTPPSICVVPESLGVLTHGQLPLAQAVEIAEPLAEAIEVDEPHGPTIEVEAPLAQAIAIAQPLAQSKGRRRGARAEAASKAPRRAAGCSSRGARGGGGGGGSQMWRAPEVGSTVMMRNESSGHGALDIWRPAEVRSGSGEDAQLFFAACLDDDLGGEVWLGPSEEGAHWRRLMPTRGEVIEGRDAAAEEEEEEVGVWQRAWVAQRLFATCEFVVIPVRPDGTRDDTVGESTHRLDAEGSAWRRLPRED